MKVLLFISYTLSNPHYDTALEIIQNHLDAEDDVTILVCNADLLTCDVNLKHDVFICLDCIMKRIQGLKLLSKAVKIKPIFYFLTKANKEEIRYLKTDFVDLNELKYFRIDNFDIGYSVLSSLISAIRDCEPDLHKHQDYLQKSLISALAVYRSIQNYLELEKPERVYAFNGRIACMRAVLRACQSKSIDCFIYEVASSIHKYSLFKNTFPHDLDHIHFLIKEAWASEPNLLKKEKIAEEFFGSLFNNKNEIISYTKDQKKGLLPKNWDFNKKNIVIFVSSEDEFAAIDDSHKNPIYKDQLDGIQQILNSVNLDNEIRIYIRIHPNLKKVKNKQTKQLNSLKYPNLTIIPADSPVSSYAMLIAASKVVTFGSTIGIEATYWGKVSILAGQSFYRNLNSTYNPSTHQELISMLYQDLVPKSKEGALMYGYYMNTYGIPYKHYQAKGIGQGTFKNVTVKTPIVIKIFSRLFRRKIFLLNFLVNKMLIKKIIT